MLLLTQVCVSAKEDIAPKLFSEKRMKLIRDFEKKQACFDKICNTMSIEDVKNAGFLSESKRSINYSYTRRKLVGEKYILERIEGDGAKIRSYILSFDEKSWTKKDTRSYFKEQGLSKLLKGDKFKKGTYIGCVNQIFPIYYASNNETRETRVSKFIIFSRNRWFSPALNDYCIN